MTTELRLSTERLTLEPLTGELAEALLSDRPRAAAILRLAVPDDWPDPDLAELLAIYHPWVRADPARLGYGPWVLVAGGTVIGSAGFQGTPDARGSIELGFGVVPAHRDRGYATEAARALLAWGSRQPTVARIVARCAPDNLPSIRVLEKVGMRRAGESDGELLWEIERES